MSSRRGTTTVGGILLILLACLLILLAFLKVPLTYSTKTLLLYFGFFFYTEGLFIMIRIKKRSLIIGMNFKMFGVILSLFIMSNYGFTAQIFVTALTEFIVMLLFLIVGVLFISHRIFKLLCGFILIAGGGFLIINYILGYITVLSEVFLFCTLGVVFMAFGLYLLIKILKRVQFLFFGLILTIFGIIELISGFQSLALEMVDFSELLIVGEAFIGGIFFTIGMIFLGCLVLPFIITGLSYLMKPLLRFTRSIMARNVLRNARRTQNTFAMISIGLAFLIMISTILGSLEAGVYPGAKLSLGGDLRVGWDSGYAPLNYSDELKSIDHVTALVPVRVLYSNCIIDEFTTDYSVQFIVINTTEYATLHNSPTLLETVAPSGISTAEFIHLLDQVNSTILYYGLADALNKSVGDFINASSAEFAYANLSIAGLCGKMPGIRYTFRTYDPPIYVAFLSWKTFFALSGYNYTTYPYRVLWYVGLDDISNDNLVRAQFIPILEEYRTVYESHIRSLRTEVEQISGILNTVFVILNQILFIALLVALLGLAITMNISIRQRRTEIGILRAMGISKGQILQMIFGETLTISLAGILFGSITGIMAGFLLTYYFPFIEWLAVIFTISWTTLVMYWGILLVTALGSSIIPAYNVNKMDIVEMIRLRGD
ncbi:MAG: ABC transporter permease [Candidatus Helarchaeota archaeon]